MSAGAEVTLLALDILFLEQTLCSVLDHTIKSPLVVSSWTVRNDDPAGGSGLMIELQ